MSGNEEGVFVALPVVGRWLDVLVFARLLSRANVLRAYERELAYSL